MPKLMVQIIGCFERDPSMAGSKFNHPTLPPCAVQHGPQVTPSSSTFQPFQS